MVQLVGANIRNVSRGVVGIALLQAILAGAGFLAAGIPAAGVLAFLALLLGILQIGPSNSPNTNCRLELDGNGDGRSFDLHRLHAFRWA